MNEQRIRELAKQAGFYFYDMHDVDGQDFGETIEADSWGAADKFAKLIVKECALTIQDFVDHRLPASEYPDRLKQHFGVEE